MNHPARPIRPLKFRLLVDAQTSPSARTPLLIPRQAPQVGLVTQKPASMKISINPSRTAWLNTAGVAGETIPRTEGAMVRPRRIAAAARRSSIRPLVHVPR